MLRQEFSKILGLLVTRGLSDDPEKRELMNYTRSRQAPVQAIRLPTVEGEQVETQPAMSIKWLGIIFDRKLAFDHHVNQLVARAEHAVQCLQILGNTIRGMSPNHFRTVYRACVVPVMEYGAAVWWKGKKSHAGKLERVQNKALVKICAAFRTSPVAALQVEAAIKPISHHLDTVIERVGIRLMKLSVSNPVMERINIWPRTMEMERRVPLPPVPRCNRRQMPFPQTCLGRISSFITPHHERIGGQVEPPWELAGEKFRDRVKVITKPSGDTKAVVREHKRQVRQLSANPNALVIYTDGSKFEDLQTGAAFVGFHVGDPAFHGEFPLGKHAEVYDTEVQALALAARRAQSFTMGNRDIDQVTFFTDNQSAEQTIWHGETVSSSQTMVNAFRRVIGEMLSERETMCISIEWVPSHQGIQGNSGAELSRCPHR